MLVRVVGVARSGEGGRPWLVLEAAGIVRVPVAVLLVRRGQVDLLMAEDEMMIRLVIHCRTTIAMEGMDSDICQTDLEMDPR